MSDGPMKKTKLPLKDKTASKTRRLNMYSKPDILKAWSNFNVILQYLWKFTVLILNTANGTLLV